MTGLTPKGAALAAPARKASSSGKKTATGTKAAWMPHGSYLIQPAPSGWALQNQVSTQKQVAARYAKAWGIPANSVPKMFAGTRVGKLPKTEVLKVYYYRPATGKWGYRLRRVHKGTAIFVRPGNSGNSTFLVQVCGNPLRPLTEQEKKDLLKPRTIAKADDPGAVAEPAEPIEDFDPHEGDDEPLIADAHPEPPSDMPLGDLPATNADTLAGGDDPFGPAGAAPTEGGGGGGAWWLPLLLGAIAGNVQVGTGSDGLGPGTGGPGTGGDGDGITPPPTDGGDPPLSAPEPSNLIVLPALLALAGCVGWRQQRRRQAAGNKA